MPAYRFETVDVFTARRFGGNPLAVFPDARGLSDADMQSIAAEFNLSETTFVLPPADPLNTARVRIFNRTAEMDFAGHPSIGTAYVLARANPQLPSTLRLEVRAGIVPVTMERDTSGAVTGGAFIAPQPLSTGDEVSVETIAACLGLVASDIITRTHQPMLISMGNPFVVAELSSAALPRSTPDIAAFERALAERPQFGHRFSLHVYARNADDLIARMFAPLAGTWEDPATGSANAPLAALLLKLSGADEARFNIRQGEHMHRPSLLRARAWRTEGGILAEIGGGCVPVLEGEAQV